MKIKAVCEHTGLSDRAVRLYIDSGLLSPDKTENYAGRRSFDFSQEDLSRLNRIAALRAAGFSIAQIKDVQSEPQSIPQIVAEVTEKQKKELQLIEKSLTTLTALREDIASFEELADELTVEEQPTPPAEDNRVRLHYLIAGFFEGAYRNGVLDGIIRAAIMAGLALLGYYVKFDNGKNAIFSAGMWFDVTTVVIAAMAAVASAVLLVRNKDIINSIVKLFLSNLTLAAAIGTMFLIWLIARIILYPARPISNETTVHIAELWIGFIGVSAVARITFLFCTILHKKRGVEP